MTTETATGAHSARRMRTRERLLDAAFEVFAEHGVAGASIEAVCEAAGFTRGAFYSNFGSKEELFLALMDRDKRRHLARLEESAAAIDPAGLRSRDGLRTAVRSMLRSVESAHGLERLGCLMRAEFELLAMRNPDIAPAYLAEHRRLVAELTEMLTRLVDSFGLRFTVDPLVAVETLLAAYDQADRAVLLGAPESDGPGSRIEDLVDVLITQA